MKCFIIFVIAIMLILIIYGVLANFYFVITNYTINSKEIYSICGDKKIVIISDLHNARFGKDNKRLIETIDKINPYCIIMAGDILNYKDSTNNIYAKKLVLNLLKKYKVLYSYGNHEQGIFADDEEFFRRLSKDGSDFDFTFEKVLDTKECYNTNEFYNFFFSEQDEEELDIDSLKKNFILVDNDYIDYKDVRIYGLRIHRIFFRRRKRPDFSIDYMTKLLGNASKDKVNVLLAHNPLYFDQYVKWGADYVVSGHVHGGFVRIPLIGGVISPQLKIFPKYSGGKYSIGKACMILSRGLGMHTIKFRVFNDPEIVVLSVKNR